MEGFVDAFFKIDTNRDNIITSADILIYTKRHNLDRKMVEKWQKLFDTEGTGKITLENFCDKLGLVYATILDERALGLGEDVKIIFTDMTLANQVAISDETRRLEGIVKDKNELIDALLKFCIGKYGAAWHIFIAKQQFWIQHEHLPGCSFHFQLKTFCYSFWKTPSMC